MVLTMALLCFAGMGAFAVVAGRLRRALARPLASRVVNAVVGVLLMALAAGMTVAH
jgi:threonine/homoserine/homoserine lactone efflux protein